jgi:putative tricarboxylic transport membrane protein
MRRTLLKSVLAAVAIAACGAPALAQSNFKIMIGANPGGAF